ncbi:ABC transporter ATP-binding protein [Thermodesulfobacteriota bacterium]
MLEINNLHAGYGSINVLWDVSLKIPEGQVTAILGPNGAGKTTLLRAIMGIVKGSQGEILLHGKLINRVKTWDMAALGMSMIPEGRMIFTDMTVEENLIMGAFPKQHRQQLDNNLEHVYKLFPILKNRKRQVAGSLSGGEAQMLAMGRGLMSAPQTILIDEPSLGLAPVVVQEVFSVLERLKQEGRTLVLVEQNTNMALLVADYVYLMQSGKVMLSKPADQIDLDQLHDLYFAR